MQLRELSAGDELGVSEWLSITQARIDEFARATNDHQWIHVDEARCEKDSPFGMPIAHGLLSTALMPGCFYAMVEIDEKRDTILNYGIDRMRYIEPVRVNDAIRYRVSLAAIEQKASGKLYRFDCTVEIQGRDKPAMIGQFLMLLVGG